MVLIVMCQQESCHPSQQACLRRYTMTVSPDGSDLWLAPVISHHNATVDVGQGGLLLLSEPTATYLAVAGAHAWQIDTPVFKSTKAAACRFYSHNNRYPDGHWRLASAMLLATATSSHQL